MINVSHFVFKVFLFNLFHVVSLNMLEYSVLNLRTLGTGTSWNAVEQMKYKNIEIRPVSLTKTPTV